MGKELVSPHISNLKGHFEDSKIVELHDRHLSGLGTNWQFHDEVKLSANNLQLNDYINERSASSFIWGVKDPRIALFLSHWANSLGNSGYFVFIARHWSGCIESLLNRHSRELAYKLMKNDTSNDHFRFWQQPDLAARTWLAYNKRILKFVKKHPKNTLLLTQRAIFEGAPILQAVNQKFGFALDTEAQSPFEDSLFNETACINVRNNLSMALRNELDCVWKELLLIADYRSKDETEKYVDNNNEHCKYFLRFKTALKERDVDVDSTENQVNISIADIENLSTLDEKDVVERLTLFRNKQLEEKLLHEIVEYVRKEHMTSSNVHLELARLLHQNQKIDSAINFYQKCILLGASFPYVYMLLGDCHQIKKELDLAIFYFDKAITSNPSNPTFYTRKAGCLVLKNKKQVAEQVLNSAIERLGYLAPLSLYISDLLITEKKYEEALKTLAQSDTSNPAIIEKFTSVKMLLDYKEGLASYYEVMAKRLKDKNKTSWLVEAARQISFAETEKDFVVRCYKHWDRLNTL